MQRRNQDRETSPDCALSHIRGDIPYRDSAGVVGYTFIEVHVGAYSLGTSDRIERLLAPLLWHVRIVEARLGLEAGDRRSALDPTRAQLLCKEDK